MSCVSGQVHLSFATSRQMTLSCAFNAVFKRYKIAAARPTIVRRVLYPRVVDKNVDVVLLKDYTPLGRKGDIVDVARGFANHNLIPRGIAVYATWENIDLYADPRNNREHSRHTDVSASHESNVISTNGMFAQDTVDIVTSLKVETFSRDGFVVCSPVSLHTVLDLLSKQHQVDLVPSQVVRVANKENDKEYNNLTRFTHTGEYCISAKMPLRDDPDNLFKFTFKLEAHEHRDNATIEGEFQLPKHRPS